MGEKLYVARRSRGQLTVTVRTASGERPLRHIAHHSPAGFELGYGGSGPADLALSILVDVLGEGRRWRPAKGEQQFRAIPRGSLAWALHQEFKREMIATADRSGLTLREGAVRDWIAEHSVSAPDDLLDL